MAVLGGVLDGEQERESAAGSTLSELKHIREGVQFTREELRCILPPDLGVCVLFGTDPLSLRVVPGTTGTVVIQIGTLSSSSDRKTAGPFSAIYPFPWLAFFSAEPNPVVRGAFIPQQETQFLDGFNLNKISTV